MFAAMIPILMSMMQSKGGQQGGQPGQGGYSEGFGGQGEGGFTGEGGYFEDFGGPEGKGGQIPVSSGGGGGASSWASTGQSLLSSLNPLATGLAQWMQSKYGKDPTQAGQKYLSQIPGELHKYMDPSMAEYSKLVADPGAVMSKIGGGFKASPGYAFQRSQAEGAAGRAAAAGGMAGSPMQQEQTAQTVTGLANQDYYNYLNKAMGLYTTGLGGEERTGTEMAENLSRLLMSQGNLAMSGEQAKEAQKWGGIGTMLQAII